MKKATFILTLIFICSVGVAHASVDTTALYGAYTGTMIDEDGFHSIDLTIGGDPTLHSTDGSSYYLYLDSSLSNWITSWNDSNGIARTYEGAEISDALYSFTDTSALGSLVSGLIRFDTDLLSFAMFGTSQDSGAASALNNFVGYFNKTATPIPGALFLLGSGLLGLVGIRRRNNA